MVVNRVSTFAKNQAAPESAQDVLASVMNEPQRRLLASVHHVVQTLRRFLDASELPAAWIDVLLFVAYTPAQSLAAIVKGSQLHESSAQKVLLALGPENRFGKPGLNVIEDIIDPRHGTRKLYFLSEKGRALMAEVMTALTGVHYDTYAVLTGREFIARFEDEKFKVQTRVDVKYFTPQEIATGKRSLSRKNIAVGRYIVAFPLLPASVIIDQIEAWVQEHGGCLHRLPTVARPHGMVIAELPNPEEQVHFHFRWRTGS